MASTAAAVVEQLSSLPARAGFLTLTLIPLALALPGLVTLRQQTLQRLALLLVVYIGAAAVEIVASLGTAMFSAGVLLLALTELSILILTSRRHAP